MTKSSQARGNMGTSQLSHLYTIWRYDHNRDTIVDHKEILRKYGHVKWLILCGREDRELFEKSLPQQELERINKQAKKVDTFLYIQCLELFREQLYAGLIDEITDGSVNLNDKLLPSYYESLLNNNALELEVICSILLTKLEPIDAEEVYNLIENKAGIPQKLTYNITKIVSQDHIHPLFNNKSTKIRELKTTQRRKERCRAIAELLWKENQNITIADMICKDQITKIGCEETKYGEKVLRDWIKNLCPNRNPGRRPK